MLSNEVSLSSSDSLDSLPNFDKFKPYDFEPSVSDNENTDGEVRSTAIQTKEAEKEQKKNLGWFLSYARPSLPMLRVRGAVRKTKSQMQFSTVTFIISNYII